MLRICFHTFCSTFNSHINAEAERLATVAMGYELQYEEFEYCLQIFGSL